MAGLVLTLVAIVALLVSALGPALAMAQDDPGTPVIDITPESSDERSDDGSANDTDANPPVDQTVVTPESDPRPTTEPTVEAEPAVDGESVAVNESAEPTPTAAAVPPVPALSYAPAAEPECRPAPGQPSAVPLGGFIDYDCEMTVELAGERLDPAAVRIAWRVEATTREGWQARLRPPATEQNPEPRWTDPAKPAEFRHESAIGDLTAQDGDGFAATERLAFGVRLHRTGCGDEAAPLALAVAVDAAAPGLDGVEIVALAPRPEPLWLVPALAPVAEPALAVSGSLNFGEIPVDALGVREEPAPQTLRVTVSGLDRACGTWELGLTATAPDGDADAEPAAASLVLVSIDDEPIADGGCALDGGCRVATLDTGASSAPAVTFTLSIALILPDQPALSAHVAALRISLDQVAPDGGAPSPAT